MHSIRKPSHAAEELERRKKASPNKSIIVGLVVLIVVMAGYVLYVWFGTKEESTETVAPPVEETIEKKPSIAVLSLYDSTPKRDNEYRCEGIADAIILALQHVKDLDVKSRNSSFVFKGENKNIRAIGDSLNAEYVLEGSLYIEDNAWRITTQLIKATDDSHIWGDTYDFKEANLFAVQDSISLAIVNALKIMLLGEEKEAIEKRYTENPEAYELYLRGRYNWNKRGEKELRKGIQLFQQAIDIDSTYALAYVGIADCYDGLGSWQYMPSDEAFSKAKTFASKALEIDNTIAEAYVSLATANMWYYWDWNAVQINLDKALELNPSYETVYLRYANFYRATGKFDAALESIQRAHELDPLSLILNLILAEIYVETGREEESLELCHKTIELDPNFSPIYFTMGETYRSLGDYKNAVDAMQKSIELAGRFVMAESSLGVIYAESGEKEKAEEILYDLLERKKEEYVSPYTIALLYFGLGENDTGFEWLEKAYEEHVSWMAFIKVHIQRKKIPYETRTKALLKKMGLPED
ncbi:tetratricopeptide repeat protein [Candidatus Latescibacterota bacterium]